MSRQVAEVKGELHDFQGVFRQQLQENTQALQQSQNLQQQQMMSGFHELKQLLASSAAPASGRVPGKRPMQEETYPPNMDLDHD